jgi:hypothetical protein
MLLRNVRAGFGRNNFGFDDPALVTPKTKYVAALQDLQLD